MLFPIYVQASLLKAIFKVDANEVRSLIFKKEDVNIQVVDSYLLSSFFERAPPNAHFLMIVGSEYLSVFLLYCMLMTDLFLSR